MITIGDINLHVAVLKAIKKITLLFVFVVAYNTAAAQITTVPSEPEAFNTDSILRDFDSRPFFGLYKDNYFVGGTSLNLTPDAHNSDAKFQVSISQRLTRTVLPFDTYLFLFYSQKAMWNVFEESMPFRDLNFNPGIGISKPLIWKDKLVGKATIMLEHESNGRDSLASRSWNKVSFCGSVYVLPRFMVHGKFWIPIVDGEHNKDILKYSGIFQFGGQYISNNKRWVVDATFVKRGEWRLSFNTTINVGFRLSRTANQFLVLHFYDGYGENMLDYNQYHCRLRLGLLIRPTFFSDF